MGSIPKVAISFHLRVLREGSLVRVRQQGNATLLPRAPEALGELRFYLKAYLAGQIVAPQG